MTLSQNAMSITLTQSPLAKSKSLCIVNMAISFPEHARSRVSGGHSSGETNFSRTISYGGRMLLNDYHQIAIHIKCGPTRGSIMFHLFHRNLLKPCTPASLRKLGKFLPREYIYLILFRWNDYNKEWSDAEETQHSVKERADGMPPGFMVNHLFSNFCLIYTIMYFMWKIQWC